MTHSGDSAELSDPKAIYRKYVAHRLLVELLAYQFAFPVRWIETQDELFSRESAILRIIEFGPTKILGGMAKQTIDAKYRNHDLSKSINRQILCSESDGKQISYEYDEPVTEAVAITQDSMETADIVAVPSASRSPAIPKPTGSAAATKVTDVPVTAREVVQSLVARKLNKAVDALNSGQSIKDLTGGKSALQNELIGILGEEFGSLPGGAEDLPISSLSESIGSTFLGSLGRESNSMVSKLISTRMPAGFSQNTIREYLELTWGLGTARQTGVLLFAVTVEPPSRLASIPAAKEYFDGLASRYASLSGIELGTKLAADDSQTSAVFVDSKQFDELRKERKEALSQNFNFLASQLNIDPSNSEKVVELETMIRDYESRLDVWSSEFDDEFESGIISTFDPQKKRSFNSWWNLVREDVLRLYHKLSMEEISATSEDLDVVIHSICNRYTAPLRSMVDCLLSGTIVPAVSSNATLSIGFRLATNLSKAPGQLPTFIFVNRMTAPRTSVSCSGQVEYKEVSRQVPDVSTYDELIQRGTLKEVVNAETPYLQLKTLQRGTWQADAAKTSTLLESIHVGISKGFSFSERTVLLTGASPGSIGDEVLRGLLMGGARAIVTTSRPPKETAKYYQGVYAECGARGSELILLPFNQGNKRDCESLIDYIYSETGLATNLDAVIPFAAIPEHAEIDRIESKSELAHRIMLVNLVRLLGHIIHHKDARKINTRPTLVLLPLSPNHGSFGGDGLYAESKLGLESLMNKFQSESWSEYLSVCGAVIGWTRGTGLMSSNDLVAEAIETHDVLTFSQREMAFNLLALMSQPIIQLCETEPILADLDGGLHALPNLKMLLAETRSDITKTSKIRSAISEEDVYEDMILKGRKADAIDLPSASQLKPRSTLRVGYPKLPSYEDLLPLQDLQGMINPDSVPVIVGFSELGPWGSSRTRWEIECKGEFSPEGYLEMAWLMNLIKHYEGEKNGLPFAGWVDAKTEEPVHDSEIGPKYGSYIMEHSGIRMIESDLFDGYDPNRKEYMHEVAVEADLPEFEAMSSIAEAFKLRHGDQVSIRRVDDSDMYKIQLKQGAVISVPKAVPFDSTVAGQIPSGWNPSRYGIPEDIQRQVDPVTLYALCCASEALHSAGLVESMEIFKHIHVSELGNFIGSMMGGTTKARSMYKDRYMDREVQGDVMQETYLSTTAAWINMLLLGSSGPIKTPTGACATGVESIDSACESLLSGKTKMCFVGGTDDFQEDESYAFRTMKATVNAREELAKGRLPSEMSRPTSDTRAGFVESQGSGVQIVTTAKLALELGLPIYGVIASSTMAADKISRSVPAPGQGVLSFARETAEAVESPLLQLDYRREQMESAIQGVRRWRDSSLQKLYTNTSSGTSTPSLGPADTPSSGAKSPVGPSATAISAIKKAANAQIIEAQKVWGNEFRRQDPDISPLRAALAVWGLTVNDIDFVSLHGTSTKANDTNEPDILNKQMSHLGRDEGRPLMAICQKSLTGHPKAPAAAFMLNGCLQALSTGMIPGNRNADNVDVALSAYPHLVFPTRPIQTRALRAFSLTSFGFGQKGGQIVGVHPRYLFATLDHASYTSYCARTSARVRIANQAYLRAMISNRIVKIQPAPPYSPGIESTVVLDPLSRIMESTEKGAWRYDSQNLRPWEPEEPDDTTLCGTPLTKDGGTASAASLSNLLIEQTTALSGSASNTSVGVDVEDLSSFMERGGIFLDRNYTTGERFWASKTPDPQSALAGRWSAKEAVFKSLGVASKGAGAAMKEIEILSKEDGAPAVKVRHRGILS